MRNLRPFFSFYFPRVVVLQVIFADWFPFSLPPSLGGNGGGKSTRRREEMTPLMTPDTGPPP